MLVVGATVDGPAAPAWATPGFLSADERERAARFRFARDRERFEGRRAILRQVLGACLERDPAELTFELGEHGKPRLAGPSGDALRFSLSHSHGCVLVALSVGREVGVDLEAYASLVDPDERELTAGRILSAGERAHWAELDPAAREAAFFRVWARKEALLKALGTGLAIDPAELDLGLDAREPDAPWGRTDEPRLSAFGTLADLVPPPGYAAALCVEGDGWSVERVAL